MAKLERKTQKIFAGQAGSRQITAFGTAKSDTPVYTNDISLIQNINFLYGWANALLPDKAPYEEDMNALFYAITRQLAYLFKEGLPEYDPETEYSLNAFVRGIGRPTLYYSLTQNNIGNDLNDTNYWAVFFDASTIENINNQINDLNQSIATLNQSIANLVPDYTRGVSVPYPTSANRFTAPSAGYYCCSFAYNNTYDVRLVINGKTTSIQYSDGQGVSGAVVLPFTVPLAQGDVIYWNKSNATNYIGSFYPYRNS